IIDRRLVMSGKSFTGQKTAPRHDRMSPSCVRKGIIERTITGSPAKAEKQPKAESHIDGTIFFALMGRYTLHFPA
ncbi:hypothetical protein, partial [Acetobacter indonesiensis]|uniref:hypothetical protein n=1 Tax=Acetobacter indonesiensis TaxID=104101 RepID=UPI0020A2648E